MACGYGSITLTHRSSSSIYSRSPRSSFSLTFVMARRAACDGFAWNLCYEKMPLY